MSTCVDFLALPGWHLSRSAPWRIQRSDIVSSLKFLTSHLSPFSGPESCGIVAPPFVVSTSYGQDESTITAFSAMRQCTEYGKLGLMGTTILYSSGDNGVAGNGGVCLNSTGMAIHKIFWRCSTL